MNQGRRKGYNRRYLSWMNVLVRWYVRRFDKELDRVRCDSISLQEKELTAIISEPLVLLLNPSFRKGGSIDQFKSEVGISSYDDYKEKVEALLKNDPKRVEYYARSSGTSTGVKKLIPTPEKFVCKNHLRGSWYIIYTLFQHSNRMNVFKAKNLLIGGAIYEKHEHYLIGDISGIMINRIPSFFRPFYVTDKATAIAPHWKEKIEKIVAAAIEEPDMALVGGVPTWVLSIFRKIMKEEGITKITDIWPGLCTYIHGGVNMSPYKSQFDEIIDSEDFLYIEVYNATEGFFAVQDDPHTDGMLLMTCSGIYYEFIPFELFDYIEFSGPIISLAEVEENVEYVMLISTQSGLLRYIQGDIVRFRSINPYRVTVTGRISEYINAFGEDLLLSQAEDALMSVCKNYDVQLANFTVGPKYITIDQKGRHDWYIEFIKQPKDLASFEKDLDEAIMLNNSNYAQKRSDGVAIEQLRVTSLERGTFMRYLELKGQMGAQSKVKKLSNDRIILEELDKFINNVL